MPGKRIKHPQAVDIAGKFDDPKAAAREIAGFADMCCGKVPGATVSRGWGNQAKEQEPDDFPMGVAKGFAKQPAVPGIARHRWQVATEGQMSDDITAVVAPALGIESVLLVYVSALRFA